MKRTMPPTPAAPVPARPRTVKTQAVQASLFALEPTETAPPRKRRVHSTPSSVPAAPAPNPVRAKGKAAKTPPAPTALAKAPAQVTPDASKAKRPKTSAATKPVTPREQPVRVVNDPVFEGGSLWKMSGKNGVAYLKDAALAGELLCVDPKRLAQAAMAVYYDKKGKAFAWQVRFDTDRWEEVVRRLA